MNPKEIGKTDWEIMEQAKKSKNIGNMIGELERNLEACRKANEIVENWKFIYSMADENRKQILIKEMFVAMGFSIEDISKMISPHNP